MGFKKVEKNIINYQPPSNDSLRLVSGNTALVTVINQVVPLSGITNIGSGPGYFYKQTQNQIAEFRGLSGDTNITINYISSGDTVGINLNDNIIVDSISATTIYSGSTDLSLLIGEGSFTQQYVSGSTGSQSLISISPAGTGNYAGDNSVVFSKNSSGFSTYSAIISGKDNLINSGADYSFISGKQNIISQPYAGGTFSQILGSNNKINGSYITIIGNYNSGYTSNSFLTGKLNLNQGTYFGIYQLLYNTYGLNNIAGSRNIIQNAGLSNIHNGFKNIIQNSTYSTLLNGTNSRIGQSSASLNFGINNNIYGSSYSIIIGGSNVIYTANTFNQQFNTIIGSTASVIKDVSKSAIFGGQLNGITGSTLTTIGQTGQNVILQGDNAKIQGSRSTIINGFNNFILDNSQDCTFISGKDNRITGSENSLIFNGRGNNIVNSTGVTLINVNNITTSSSDSNLLITNQIRSLSLTGATTQMVVADVSGNLLTQAIPTGVTGTALFSGTTAGGIKQIYPIDNNIADSSYSLSFGFNNTTKGKYSTILNGLLNIIIDNNIPGFYNNAIIGGYNNNIYQGKYSIINNGKNNNNSGYYSSILNGGANKIYAGADHSVIFGFNNKTQSYNSFVFGLNNSVTGVSHSSILGGKYNFIYRTAGNYLKDYNIISNSKQSKILNSSFSNISSGSGNTISSANYSSVLNGLNNKSFDSFTTVVGGKSNTAYTAYSVVLNGSGNTSLGISSIILGGFNNKNTTASTNYSFIGNGFQNQISSCFAGFGSNIRSDFASVLNGKQNHTLRNYSTIINGITNHSNGYFSFIGNGSYNRTNLNHTPDSATTVLNGIRNSVKHNFATVLNGYVNTTETDYGLIGNGFYNQLPSQGFFGTVLNGKRNNSQGGYFNQILNGDYNLIAGTNIRHNTIINGSGHRINNNLSGVTILGGVGLTATTSNVALGDFAQFRSLTGGGTQMVVANSSGLLSVQAIPAIPPGAYLWTTPGSYPSSVILNNSYTNSSSVYSLVAGKDTSIGSNSQYSSILGGKGNVNTQNSPYSLIVGGFENYIRDYASYTFIGGGKGNYLYNSKHSFIGSGYQNRIYNGNSNSESKYNSILSGKQNKLNRTIYSTILGGYNNIIGDNSNLFSHNLIFGNNHTLNTYGSAIIGGNGYLLTESNTVLVPKLKIANLPVISSPYLLNANLAGNLYKISLSGGTGIKVDNSNGKLTITYTGSSSSSHTIIDGLNTFTAGTSTVQSVNISAATLNNLTVTGSTSITTLSANTIFSGSTNLSSIFEPRQTNYRQILSTNYVMTSSTAVANFSFNVLAGEVYKAEMYSLFQVNNTGGMKLTLSGNALFNCVVRGNTSNLLTNSLRPVNSTGNTATLGVVSNTTLSYIFEGIISAITNTTIALGFSPQTNGQQITIFSGACMTLQKI